MMDGVLNILKPPAMTSAGVVSAVRRILDMKKVGHTGTLDPGAAGVLPVCVGRATKISDYLMAGEKRYTAEVTFGKATDTGDSYGTVIKTGRSDIGGEELGAALPHFTGDILQSPPMYAAIKHEGKKLYELARRGETVQRPPRGVHIYDIQILHGQPGRYLLDIKCSKGTYVRALAVDIAERLGTCAYLSFLLRTQSGGYGIDGAYTLDEVRRAVCSGGITNGFLQDIRDALAFMPTLHFAGYLLPIIQSGAPVDLARAGMDVPDGLHAAYCEGRLMGVGQKQGGLFRLKTALWQK